MKSAYSRSRLESHLEPLYHHARTFMSNWAVGDTLPAVHTCRRFINSQISQISVSVDSQDIIDDIIEYKVRALSTHVLNVLPKFMLSTPGMRRRKKSIAELLDRVQNVHTPAQRAGCPRDLADKLLNLHASDPQFLPESNLRFALSAPLIASVYLGDAISFTVYAMASQPEFYNRIRSEANALFDNGDPSREQCTPESTDVTRRFIMECLRLYSIVPTSVRNVMNTCLVEGYELPEGVQVFIAQSAAHYMEDVFPDPKKFDIDRYLHPRNEHHSPGYAPFGLGTHMSRLAVDGTSTGHQPDDDRALLHASSLPRKLQTKDQPVSVAFPKQEAEVRRRRAKTRNKRLNRHHIRRTVSPLHPLAAYGASCSCS